MAAIIFVEGPEHILYWKKIIPAQNDALFGCLIFLTEYFQKLNFDENMHHGHKNTKW